MKRVTWRLLPFLLLLYIISWLDRVNVGFAKLQMNADLGFSETIYGIGAGIFFVGYGLCEVPSNLLLVRFGARVVDRAHHDHVGPDLRRHDVRARATASFYVLRFLLGVAEAGFLPGIIYYLSQWFPREHRANAVSWFMIGIPLSLVFGGAAVGLAHAGPRRSTRPARLAVDVPGRGFARGDPRLRRAGLSHRKARRRALAHAPSSAPGSRERHREPNTVRRMPAMG